MLQPADGGVVDGASLPAGSAVSELSHALPSRSTPSLRARGLLSLRFWWDQARQATRVETVDQRAPLRILRAFPHGPRGALVHLHNHSGGVLGGDELEVRLAVAPQAHALLTTTGASRIYRARPDEPPARQTLTAVLADGARLEYLPDPTIPYQGSALEQATRWRLEGRAGLLTWDILTPGRQGFEPDFSFHRYANETAVHWNGTPLVLERYTLTPASMALRSLARLGDRTHLGTLLFFDGATPASAWLALERVAHQRLDELSRSLASPAFMFGVSATAGQGLAVRVLDGSAEGMMVAFDRLRETLLGLVWGAASPLPRKIY